MKRAFVAVVVVLLAGCGSIDPITASDASADADAADALTFTSDAALDSNTSDVGLDAITPDAACSYAAGCCSTRDAVECVNGSAFACEPFDDSGVDLGWFALDSSACLTDE